MLKYVFRSAVFGAWVFAVGYTVTSWVNSGIKTGVESAFRPVSPPIPGYRQ